jgi:hypothetical protein
MPADSPKLKGVFITFDFKNIEAGESDVFFNGDGSRILPQLSLFLTCGVWRKKSVGSDFFEVFNTTMLFSVKGFFWYKKHII